MTSKMMYLPGFAGLMRASRASASAKQVMGKVADLSGLAKLMANFFPFELFDLKDGGRNRMFTPMITFLSFLGQVMTRDSSCREAVRQVQEWYLSHSTVRPDDSTSAYCQARARLDVGQIRGAFRKVCDWFERSL